MTATGRLIPRQRLQRIPRSLRLAHEYCYFLHDECVRVLVEYEAAEAHFVEVRFQSKAEASAFTVLAKDDSIAALRAMGWRNQARRVILNTITMAMVSDCLLHLFEALKCLEKRKSTVALNLLRKPLMDSLVYLSWILGDEDTFYGAFTSGDPEVLTPRKLGNRRREIIAQALAKTQVAELLDADFIRDSIFDAKNAYGLYELFQHAVHLITVNRIEIRTAPENFNFIFKDPSDDDVYEGLYRLLPSLLLYLTHVTMELFDRVEPMDEGIKTAFFVRSTFGFHLVEGGQSAEDVRNTLRTILSPHIWCGKCEAPLTVTPHNASRIVLAESFRCTRCQSVHDLPFSWLFQAPSGT